MKTAKMKFDGNGHVIREIEINPKLPAQFDATPNDRRPPSHQRWWHSPYIVSYSFEQMALLEIKRQDWFGRWPSGTRYDVRCLDGGAWDRSTWWGSFATLDAAVSFATRLANFFRDEAS